MTPTLITLAGTNYPLGFPLGVVTIYQQMTAAIERTRHDDKGCHPDRSPSEREGAVEGPAVLCRCGATKGQHTGPSLIRLGDDQSLLCAGFRADDPALGDSLFRMGSWSKADPDYDPERFLALLWCGLHCWDATQKKFVPALSLEELSAAVDFGNITALHRKVIEAMVAYFPKAKPGAASPNVPAPDAPAPTTSMEVQDATVTWPTRSPRSLPLPDGV